MAGTGDLFVVLYSITDRSSFNEARRIGRYLKVCKNSDSLCLALVGTKSDLEHLRTVNFEEGSNLSGELKSTFHEISIREEVKEVQDMMHDAIKHYLQNKTSTKDTLRVPNIGVGRSPSFDRRKQRSHSYDKMNIGSFQGYHPAEKMKSKSSVEIRLNPVGSWSSGYNRIKELSSSLMSIGSTSDLRVMDQYHNARTPSDEELSKVNKSSNMLRSKGPFFIQKDKAISINKGLKVPPTMEEERTVEGSSETKIKNPFMLNKKRKGCHDSRERVKDSSSNEKTEKGKTKVKASSPNTRKKPSPGVESSVQAQEKPKGPFSLKSSPKDKLGSSSSERLRSISSDKARSSYSLTRMKEGITRSFRRKPIYL